jgi:hypothetical protein
MSPQRLPHTKSHYTAGTQLETLVKNLNLSHFKIVVVETAQNTFLDDSPPNSTLNILYTENNRLVAEDKGNRELRTCTTVSTTTLSPTTISSLK